MLIHPTTAIAECPQPLDVLFIPGGFGTRDMMADEQVLDFVRSAGASARYVASVCTGSLVLGAAGLFDGYRATAHWTKVDDLAQFGATPERSRVVRDRNRITAGGITAGIDFGLTLLAELKGERVARATQLMMEYDPAPPFASGTPTGPDDPLIDDVRAMIGDHRRRMATP